MRLQNILKLKILGFTHYLMQITVLRISTCSKIGTVNINVSPKSDIMLLANYYFVAVNKSAKFRIEIYMDEYLNDFYPFLISTA